MFCMRFRSASAVMMAVAIATGCATTGNSSAFRPEPGTTVEVTKQLDFPHGSTRLYIQGGMPVRYRDVDRFVPHCAFKLDRKRDGQPLADSVMPGTFTIGKTRHSLRVSDAGTREPVRVASSSDGATPVLLQLAEAADATPTIFLYDTIIAVHSEEQPQVADLTCSYDGGSFGDHLSPAEISDALGELVRFY
ncbi:MAG: hypothetical protein U5R46_01205 [Gammaproteobacteria bacterium]|nr:hypothetical protein [Gammaproteobacteria bacterium]